MKRFTSLTMVAVMAVFLTGCPAPQEVARDSIAGALGIIVTAQAQFGTACRETPTLSKCVAVNRLVDAQHAAAAALVVYCSGPSAGGVLPYKDGGACVPVRDAGDALKSAVENMNLIVETVKSLLAREAA